MPDFEQLKQKAHDLPLAPGVYIMADKNGKVIYVGKAKALRNRVSQYFVDSAGHSEKTRAMVRNIHDFSVIIAQSEFEALVLECSLIKLHQPKYNILLRDDKGYPYIRLDMNEEYPNLTMVSKPAEDGAKYFGPYGGRSVTQNAINTIKQTLRLPSCSKKFPRDIGKDRPCLNYHMGQCDGWCQKLGSQRQYYETVRQAQLILEGKYKQAAAELREQMEAAAEELKFEQAAELRDRCLAIESLGKKQRVVSGAMADTDVIGWYSNDNRGCFVILHYIGGNLVDKEFRLTEPESEETALSALVKQYYLERTHLPREILLPQPMEDSELFAQLLSGRGHKVKLAVPQRGDKTELIKLAHKNAVEEAERVTTAAERVNKTLELVAQLLNLAEAPKRIEAYDMSNTAGTDMVGSMTVFVDGNPLKKDYRTFKIKDESIKDDYHAMQEVLTRRLTRLVDKSEGFEKRPDLLLMDGGQAQCSAAEDVLAQLGLAIPVYGMVKDDRHRTRALMTASGQEISISGNQAVFSFFGRIQEETHRFAIEYHRSLRAKKVKQSELEKINGVGQARRTALLKHFKTIKAIKAATLDELEAVVPKPAAKAVFEYFHKGTDEKCE